jgi:hypothetical protein
MACLPNFRPILASIFPSVFGAMYMHHMEPSFGISCSLSNTKFSQSSEVSKHNDILSATMAEGMQDALADDSAGMRKEEGTFDEAVTKAEVAVCHSNVHDALVPKPELVHLNRV